MTNVQPCAALVDEQVGTYNLRRPVARYVSRPCRRAGVEKVGEHCYCKQHAKAERLRKAPSVRVNAWTGR